LSGIFFAFFFMQLRKNSKQKSKRHGEEWKDFDIFSTLRLKNENT